MLGMNVRLNKGQAYLAKNQCVLNIWLNYLQQILKICVLNTLSKSQHTPCTHPHQP